MLDILVLCARLQIDPDASHRLVELTARLDEWGNLDQQAEEQGLSPLVYRHLQQAGASIPRAAKLSLQGLYLRHRHTNQVRSQLLAEIWCEFQRVGIPAVVVKGAALAHLVYKDVALRPMRDIDILVRRADLAKAQASLIRLGYRNSAADTQALPDKHLAPYTREVGGCSTNIELHYNLFDSFAPLSITYELLQPQLLQFECAGVAIDTLGPNQMLVHLCEHLAYHASIWEPIRLIWIVDVVGFAEKYVDQIDWAYLAKCHPVVLKMLSLFHHVSPLSEHLQKASHVQIGAAPQGVGMEFNGWPRHSRHHLRRMSWQAAMRESFFPSAWWLRLHYRLDSVQSLFWHRWFLHPLYVLGPLYLVEKVKLFWFLRVRRRFEEKL